jgi:hypothetical protein
MTEPQRPADLSRATLSDLLQLQEGYASGVDSLKARLAEVKAEVSRRYAASAVQTLGQLGKEHGSGKLELQDGFAVKYKVDREVKWDSAALMAVAQTLPWERVRQIFKIEFSVPEKIYAGIAAAAPELAQRIDAARTTKIKEPSVTLVKEEPLA